MMKGLGLGASLLASLLLATDHQLAIFLGNTHASLFCLTLQVSILFGCRHFLCFLTNHGNQSNQTIGFQP